MPTAAKGKSRHDVSGSDKILFGERTGTRTQDLLIKSQLLYRLSYALPRADGRPESGAEHRESVPSGQPQIGSRLPRHFLAFGLPCPQSPPFDNGQDQRLGTAS